MHAKAVTTMFIQMKFSRDMMFQQRLIKKNAVSGRNALVVTGLDEETGGRGIRNLPFGGNFPQRGERRMFPDQLFTGAAMTHARIHTSDYRIAKDEEIRSQTRMFR